MKIKIFIIIILAVILTGKIQLQAEGLSLSADSDLLMPADQNYKDLYGGINMIPGLKMTINLSKKIYLWGSYSAGSFSGETLSLKYPMKCKRNFFNFGAGYNFNIFKPVRFFIEGGGAFANFEEESFGYIRKGSKMGFTVNGGIRINIFKSVFIHLTGGYIMADAIIEEADVKLGGITIGGGLGMSF